MNKLIAPLWELITAAQPIVTTVRPALVTDGVDITTWRTSSYAPPLAVVLIEGSAAADLTSPTGADGVELWGLIQAKWKFLGVLKSGATIHIISADLGHAEEIEHVGIATRLFVAATVSAGNVTAKFAPLEQLGAA